MSRFVVSRKVKVEEGLDSLGHSVESVGQSVTAVTAELKSTQQKTASESEGIMKALELIEAVGYGEMRGGRVF